MTLSSFNVCYMLLPIHFMQKERNYSLFSIDSSGSAYVTYVPATKSWIDRLSSLIPTMNALTITPIPNVTPYITAHKHSQNHSEKAYLSSVF